MSGHSKWHTIKHAKGAADAKRGQLFTKLTREIIIAVREGGPSVEGNYRLRLAVQKARDANMPMDNIDRAIAKASGGGEAGGMVELAMEGYGPGGVAILVNILTDNRNRAVQEVRNVFNRNNGNLGEKGSVAFLFQSRGVITVRANGMDPDELGLKALDAGAEDARTEGDYVEIYTKPDKLEAVRKALTDQKIPVESAEVSMIAKQTVTLSEKAAFQTLRLLEKLEELDDVQSVASNADFSDEIVEKYQQAGDKLPV
jgi:YebC/PmpR family DNA-binding regulatory protein